jgi:hypothetical protein
MKLHSKFNIFIVSICFVLVLVLALLPFCIYDIDGYFLWFPIVSEYLKGDVAYHGSEVIFDGQNLASIYGELPFWKLFRIMGLSIESFLNLTHGTFVILFFILSLNIVWGIKKSKQFWDIVIVFTFCLFSPVIVNRISAGHLNLLFGVLPFFVFTSLIFKKTIPYLVFCTFCLWCAWSTQAFQILAYHIFYLPLLIYLFLLFESNRVKYFSLSVLIFVIAFSLNFFNFLEMFSHAVNPDNVRNMDFNYVYSYVTSTLHDSVQFFLSGNYPETFSHNKDFYHEISYPIGSFIIILLSPGKESRLNWTLFLSMVFLFLFCMNIPGLNLLSELPIIKPFRVPQRAFMVLGLFIPIWCYAINEPIFKRKDLFLFILFLILAQFVHYFEIIVVVFFLILFFYKKYQNKNLALLFAFAGLYTGTYEKLSQGPIRHDRFLKITELLSPLRAIYSERELRKIKFHFETTRSMEVNYVAQTMGISTLEGYGHPPASLYKKIKQVTSLIYPSDINSVYFTTFTKSQDEILKKLGVQTVVRFGKNNELILKDL